MALQVGQEERETSPRQARRGAIRKGAVMTLPSVSSYGHYASSNYGVNTLRFDVGALTVWFSYKTPVAFQNGWGSTMIVRENDWGPTTGKHLNWIDDGDKGSRISGAEFEAQLGEILQ